MKNLILMLTAALMSVSPKASAVELQGKCGNGVFWQIRDSVLTISGSGAMDTYGYSNVVRDENGNMVAVTVNTPYDNLKAGVKSVVVGQGVTAIGDCAFLFLKNLTSVYLSEDVAGIGKLAFAANYRLSAITSLNPEPPGCRETAFSETALSGITLTVSSDYVNIYRETDPWSGMNVVEEEPVEEPGDDPYGELKGSCGIGVSWKIQDSVLTVRGNGAMNNYGFSYTLDGNGAVTGITARTPYDAHKAGIESVVVEQGVTHIGNCAFMYFENLTSVYLSGSVTSIGEYALAANSGLSAITSLNPTPPACHNTAFNDTDLPGITLTVPSGRLGIYKQTAPWSGIRNIIGENGEVQGTCGDGVFWEIQGSVLTVSGSGAMDSYTYSRVYDANGVLLGITTTAPYDALKAGIESVVVGPGVTHIGTCAFMDFENLTSVFLPESVDAIGENALAANSRLSVVTSLNPNPPSCHDGTLANIDLSRVTLFVPYGRSGIYSQTAPWSGMQVVERDEFACGNGVFWEVRDSVLTIGGNGAMDDYSYEEFYEWGVGMSSRINTPYNAHRAGIKSVIVGPGVTHIGTCAFMDFKNLTSVSLPGSAGSIGQGALAMNGSLSEITSFALNPPSCNGTVFEQTDLDSITLTVPYGRSSIYKQTSPWSGIANIVEGGAEKIALSGPYGSNHTWVLDTVRGVATVSGKGRLPDSNPLRGLRSYIKTVSLNEGITAIPAKAFESFGSLEKVIFPFDCDVLGAAAFGSCTALKSLVFKGYPPSIQTADGGNTPTFDNVNLANVTVYVRPDMLERFQGISKWQAFKQILPFEALPESHDASLKSLTATGFLTPLFSHDIYDYTVVLADSVDNMTIAAVANHPSATVAGAGYKSLDAGENSFEIAVTAENMATVNTYTIRVKRVDGARDATLKSFTVTPCILLSPSFSPELHYYIVYVPDDTREILIELETADSASILDDGPGYSLPGLKTLSPFLPNVYDFLVLTEDRQSYMYYRLTVRKESSLGISGISGDEIKVYLENKKLSVISPAAEDVNIYTVTGKLLHSLKKQPGKASAIINYPERILIVKGSSGWSRKVICGVLE